MKAISSKVIKTTFNQRHLICQSNLSISLAVDRRNHAARCWISSTMSNNCNKINNCSSHRQSQFSFSVSASAKVLLLKKKLKKIVQRVHEKRVSRFRGGRVNENHSRLKRTRASDLGDALLSALCRKNRCYRCGLLQLELVLPLG